MNNQQSQLNPQAASIVKAIAYTENGGKLDLKNPSAGQTGEMKSVFQFEPGTWKAYAKQISGDENLPMTPENESLVTYSKVNEWLNKGYDVKQIASMWNAGPGESDAYTGSFSDGSPSTGTNKKYGVKYDVPGYADKVAKYAEEFSAKFPQQDGQSQTANQTNPSTTPQVASQTPPQTQTNDIPGTTQNQSLLRSVLSSASKLKKQKNDKQTS